MFFTRLPCPRWVDHDPTYLTKSSRYFPLVGIIVGGLGACIYLIASFVFAHSISIVLSMIATILITGAFHEDGLADVCDGFGGGWTKDDILRIMKDSRIGAYGVIGTICALGLKFLCLLEMPHGVIVPAMISGHALSRFAGVTLLYTHPYVRSEDVKAKPAAEKMDIPSLLLAGIFGLMPLLLFKDAQVLWALVPVFVARFWLGRYFRKWIGGQTGDCGGATQQVCEVVFYLTLPLVWKLY